MKKVLAAVWAAIAVFLFAGAQPALADGDLALGAKIFNTNCAACHANGVNVVMAPKNLKKESLEKFGMYSADAIMTQVRNGKNAMPAFGAKLKDDQIAAVASYVLAQADKSWAK